MKLLQLVPWTRLNYIIGVIYEVVVAFSSSPLVVGHVRSNHEM